MQRHKLTAALPFLFLSLPAFAALSANTQWEVRTTGTDTNGGGFVAGSGGTDYSQQNSPHVTFNGSTITATTTGASATIIITGYTVATTDVGNNVNISGGTNFLTGVYQIGTVSTGANSWTLDRAATSGVGAAMTGTMGGGFLTISKALGLCVNGGNVVNIQAGTYTITVALEVNNNNLTLIGYQTTHGDEGTKPLITTSTNSLNNFINETSSVQVTTFDNLSLSTTAGTPGVGIMALSGTWSTVTVRNSLFTGFADGIDGEDQVNYPFSVLNIDNTEFLNGAIGVVNTNGFIISNSWFVGQSTYGASTGQHTLLQNSPMVFENTVFSGGAIGIMSKEGAQIYVQSCDFANNSSDGIQLNGSGVSVVSVQNDVFYNNGGYGINVESASNLSQVSTNRNNAFGSNTSGATNNFPAGTGTVTLSANPFNANFSLNNTAGGGALLRGTGYPGVFLTGATGYPDIGALQHQSTGGQVAYPIVQ